MNNKEFIAALAQRSGYSTKTTIQMSNALVDTMVSILENDETLTVVGFGSFEVKLKKERILVNPQTKQKMLVPPKLSLSFKPNTSLKDNAR